MKCRIIIMSFLMRILFKFSKLIPDKIYITIQNWMILGKGVNWNEPSSFSDKLQYLKLKTRNPLYTKLVDKIAVKEYVSEIIGGKYIIPTLGVFERVEDIVWDELPEQFVMKCNHDGGSNSVVLCYDKSKLDKRLTCKKLKSRLSFNNYWHTKEWPYKNIKPCVLVEKLILTSSGSIPEDYKFYCFNGEPKVLLLIEGRGSDIKYTYIDMDFNVLPLMDEGKELTFHKPVKPQNFEEMKALVRKLAKGFPFVRLDFYNTNGYIYFGEYTFYVAGGFKKFIPTEWNNILGDWIDITKIK